MSQFGKQYHGKSNTKSSGNGKRKLKLRGKRMSETGSYFSATKLSSKNATAPTRRKGGSRGVRLKSAGFANVLTKQGYKKAKITGVAEAPDNRNFARQGVITKGCILVTELGNAVVLNRPGREGAINAKLLA